VKLEDLKGRGVTTGLTGPTAVAPRSSGTGVFVILSSNPFSVLADGASIQVSKCNDTMMVRTNKVRQNEWYDAMVELTKL